MNIKKFKERFDIETFKRAIPWFVGIVVSLYLIVMGYNFGLSLVIGVVIVFVIDRAMKGGFKNYGMDTKESTTTNRKQSSSSRTTPARTEHLLPKWEGLE